MAQVSKDEFKAVMGSFAAGVTVITTVTDDGKLFGLTATAFSSLSLDPPLGLVCIDRRAASHDAIAESRRFAVNLLRAGQEELSNRFASRSDDKFQGVAHRPGDVTGCPLFDDALAAMECRVVEVLAGGDHSIFVGELCSVRTGEGLPLVHWRGAYRGLASQ
jgi:flavin reductase (DIM6/NTAB) family NADH-FMN oxidoreductase RutF